MVQITGKTASTKKSVLPPKKKEAKPSAVGKTTATKSTTQSAVKKVKKTARAVGNGELPTLKKATKRESVVSAVTPEQRYRMICDAAYYRAEQRGFIGGSAEQDWRDAETEVDQKLCAVQVSQKNH